MDASPAAVLGVFMRWLHIVSAITIVGGFIYARYMVAPALASLAASERLALADRIVGNLRPILYTALVTVLVSGLYNYLTKSAYPPHYHMIIGVKFLFVLHVFATAVLYTIPNANEGNRLRRLTWLVISGVVIVAISADLRFLSLGALGAR
jgi:hypothetical protein